MDFDTSSEQDTLRDSVRRFIDREYDWEKRFAVIRSPHGVDPAHWATFAELGWLGAGLSEEAGGFGGGAIENALIAQELGRGLVTDPFVEHILATQALVAIGGKAAGTLIGAMVMGEMRVVPAFQEEGGRGDGRVVEASATGKGEGTTVSGTKTLVEGAGNADQLIVSALSTAGVGLYLVDAKGAGVVQLHYRTVDNRRVADIVLTNAPAVALATGPGAAAAIEQGIDHALGAMAGDNRAAQSTAASAAKQVFSTAGLFVGGQAIQLHGGIGVTEELNISHYYRRLFVIARQFGDADLHGDRFADGVDHGALAAESRRRQSGSDPHDRQSAIHDKRLPGDMTGRLRRHERDHPGNILGLGNPLQCRSAGGLFTKSGFVEQSPDHVGGSGAGRDRIDPHAAIPPFDRELPHHLLQRGLRHAIDAAAGEGDMGIDRRYAHHRPAAPRRHMGQAKAREPQRAADIHVHDLGPARLGQLGQRIEHRVRRRIGDQYVDTAKGRERAVDQPREIVFRRRMAGDGDTIEAVLAHLPLHRRTGFRLARRQGDARALLCQKPRGGEADAARAAGDDGNFARKGAGGVDGGRHYDVSYTVRPGSAVAMTFDI